MTGSALLARARGLTLLAAVVAPGLGLLLTLAHGLPFYFEDIEFVQAAHSRAWGSLLADLASFWRFHGFDRPGELLTLKLLHLLFGWNAAPYRWFKFACLTAVAAGLSGMALRGSRYSLLASSCFLAICWAHPVFQSTLWICDFEVVAQAASVGALLLWCRFLHSAGTARGQVVRLGLVFVLLLLAVKTKATALSAAIAIVVSAVPFGFSTAGIALVLASPVLMGAMISGEAIQFKAATAGALALQTLPYVGYGIPLLGAAVSLIAIWAVVQAKRRRVLPGSWIAALGDRRVEATVLTSFATANVALWPLLPSSETRYLAAFLPSAIALGCLGLVALVDLLSQWRRSWRPAAVVVVLAGLLGLAGTNLRPAFHFRSYWGSLFLALDYAQWWIERHEQGAVVLYDYWRPMLYSGPAHPANEYLLLKDFNRSARALEKRPKILLSIGRPIGAEVTLAFVAVGDSGGAFDALIAKLGNRTLGLHLMTGKLLPTDAPLPFRVYAYRL